MGRLLSPTLPLGPSSAAQQNSAEARTMPRHIGVARRAPAPRRCRGHRAHGAAPASPLRLRRPRGGAALPPSARLSLRSFPNTSGPKDLDGSVNRDTNDVLRGVKTLSSSAHLPQNSSVRKSLSNRMGIATGSKGSFPHLVIRCL